MSDLDDFDDGLRKLRGGITRAHEAFNEADAGFLQALDALAAVARERGTIREQLTEMRATIHRLEALVLQQNADLRAQGAELHALRARLNGGEDARA